MYKFRLTLMASAVAVALAGCGGDDDNDTAQAPDDNPGVEQPGDGNDGGADQPAGEPKLQLLGRYAPDDAPFDEGSAEIVAYDAATQRIFVVNADSKEVDVLDAAAPSAPALLNTLDVAGDVEAEMGLADGALGAANSLAVRNGVMAVAIEADDKQAPGYVAFYDTAGNDLLGAVQVGALPDMVTFTPDGDTVLVANEGEPADDYSVDPEGSVSVIDISGGVASASVATAGFADFNVGGPRHAELPAEVRIFGNKGRTEKTIAGFEDSDPARVTLEDASGIEVGDWLTIASDEDPIPYRVAAIDGNTLTFASDFDGDTDLEGELALYLHDGASSVAEDLEPEYIAVSEDGATAWVSLQENNALAEIDVEAARVDRILALGFKDHGVAGNGLDPSKDDDAINIRTWPLMGMYMPDTIASYSVDGRAYVVTANEGDSREYDAFVEEADIEDLVLDGGAIANAGELQKEENLGGLGTTTTLGDEDGDNQWETLYAYGARSFSIWDADGQRVFDSGDDFEQKIAEVAPDDFNSNNDENDSFDDRSDNKGPEPEALTLGQFGERELAFIGLERQGGIMVYDITDPAAPEFLQYTSNRDFGVAVEDDDETANPAAGDLGPEGMAFVAAEDSPTGEPLLVVGNEISGSTTIYRVTRD